MTDRTVSVDVQLQIGASYHPDMDEDDLVSEVLGWADTGLEGLLGYREEGEHPIESLEIEGFDVTGVHLHEPGEE